MFDKDFYPTPKSLIYKMADKVNWRNVTYALEPSAGKGDIVDHFTKPPLSHRGGRQYWELVEKNNELRSILFGKGYTVTGEDFFRNMVLKLSIWKVPLRTLKEQRRLKLP